MTPREVILRALDNYRGDDLQRARVAFKGLTDEQMRQHYGDSGLTRLEIIQDYERRNAEVDAAVAWVRAANASMERT